MILRNHDTSPMTNEVLKEKTLVAVRTRSHSYSPTFSCPLSWSVRVGPALAALRAVEWPFRVWQATALQQAIRAWEDLDQRMLREKERADEHKSVVAELIRNGDI